MNNAEPTFREIVLYRMMELGGAGLGKWLHSENHSLPTRRQSSEITTRLAKCCEEILQANVAILENEKLLEVTAVAAAIGCARDVLGLPQPLLPPLN